MADEYAEIFSYYIKYTYTTRLWGTATTGAAAAKPMDVSVSLSIGKYLA